MEETWDPSRRLKKFLELLGWSLAVVSSTLGMRVRSIGMKSTEMSLSPPRCGGGRSEREGVGGAGGHQGGGV